MYIQSDTSAAIRTVQKYLNEVFRYEGLDNPPPIDGYFGKATKDAVILFQAAEGLSKTGAVDLTTFEHLRDKARLYEKNNTASDFLYSKSGFPIRKGARGADVEALHALLQSIKEFEKELPSVPRVGYYSRDTEAAVLYMQRLFLYEETGEVSADLYGRLENELIARRIFN